MGNRGGAQNAAYGYPYGTITTPGAVIEEPWAVTQWTEYYIPTVRGGGRRPVIYVAAPLPVNPCGGFGGGLGGYGGFGGLGGGLGGLGGGLGGLGGYGGGLF